MGLGQYIGILSLSVTRYTFRLLAARDCSRGKMVYDYQSRIRNFELFLEETGTHLAIRVTLSK